MRDDTDAPTPPLILASASPRRRKILADLGLRFAAVVPDVAEVHWDDQPVETVRENARRKCAWCRSRHAAARIVAADTVVALAGRSIGKPTSLAEAQRLLAALGGRTHSVFTGVALAAAGEAERVHVVESTVTFRALAPADIARYLALVDPLDKAGAYDIDQHGEILVAGWTGSWTNIMGLPAEVVGPWAGARRRV